MTQPARVDLFRTQVEQVEDRGHQPVTGKVGVEVPSTALLKVGASCILVSGPTAGVKDCSRIVRSPLELQPIGWVESPLVDRAQAPLQGHEGAPDAWLVFEPEVSEGLRDLHVGDDVLVLTWLDRAERDVLTVHPRNDVNRPETGVFSTRSPDRPNPVGLHRVTILSIDGTRVEVRNLEALDGTPVVDVKPVLAQDLASGA